MPVDYDLMYNPRLTVPNYQDVFARWVAQSESARKNARCHLDVPYGPHETERMDIFPAEGRSKALLMFIHGGFWRSLDKRDFSFVAPSFTRAGVTVAIPNYALCPAVTVEDIVRQMLQASAWLHRNGVNFGAPREQVYVCGHSAGGHLTAMMLAALWPVFSPDLPANVAKGGMSISGIYDVTEIVKVPSVNSDVGLTRQSARKVSPAFMPPATAAPLYTAVGGKENEGFHKQNRVIAERWKSVHAGAITCPDDDHFSVLDRLTDWAHPLYRTTLGMMGVN